jgi:hypothetical protein
LHRRHLQARTAAALRARAGRVSGELHTGTWSISARRTLPGSDGPALPAESVHRALQISRQRSAGRWRQPLRQHRRQQCSAGLEGVRRRPAALEPRRVGSAADRVPAMQCARWKDR